MRLYALHGFLGQPADWSFLQKALPELTAVDIFSDFVSCTTIKHCGKLLNQRVQEQKEKRTLIGYSLGGRLALHALIDAPQLWQKAIIISAHPGLQDEERREYRVSQDKRWAIRAREDPWDRFLKDWHDQPVFAKSFHPERKESEFNREVLSHALIHWSLGTQSYLKPSIGVLPMPILWIVGHNDRIYKEIAEELSFKHPDSQVLTIQGAGHRAPWDQPGSFTESVLRFLSER